MYNIAELLSAQTGKEMAMIEKFLTELIAIINDSIMQDHIVQVKGIGTFKVVLVRERESVHVNTGERIVIPSHHKITFLPETKLKDLINKPFASFETIEVGEDQDGLMNLTSSEKEETDKNMIEKDNLPVYQEPKPVVGNEEEATKQEREEQSTPPEPVPLSSPPPPPPPPPPVDSESIMSTWEEKPMQPAPEPVPVSLPAPVPFPPVDNEIHPTWEEERVQPEPKPVSSPPTPPSPPSTHRRRPEKQVKTKKQKAKKPSITALMAALFFLLFVLLGGGIWYFFFYNKTSESFYAERFGVRIAEETTALLSADTIPSDVLLEEVNAALDSMAFVQPESNGADTTGTEVAEEPATVPVSTSPASATATPETAPPPTTARPVTTTSPQTATATTSTSTSANNVMARVRIESGQRLTLIAEKYYGLKVFWVYIYEFNKTTIGSNPDRVSVGMEILVPAKELYDIDANSAASVERATALQRSIMGGN